MRGIGKARRIVRRFWLSVHPRALILLYHRIARAQLDPQLLCVTPEHFAEHLKYLYRHYYPISLLDLKKALDVGRIPSKAVVVTIDDGYADNLYNAKPLLKQYGVPATVFLTTGYIGQEFWSDELARLLLSSLILPECLKVSVDGKPYEWGMGKWARLSPSEISAYRGWNVGLRDDPTPRHRAYRDLHRLLRPLSYEEREAVLTSLRTQVGNDGQCRPNYRVLMLDEVRNLAEGGLVEIGAHTVNHLMLATKPLEDQWRELVQSKMTLEAILGRPVTTFAYPYGSRSDVGRIAIKLAQEAGFKAACAVTPGPVMCWANPFWLPRNAVMDWDIDEFARRLSKWFHK